MTADEYDLGAVPVGKLHEPACQTQAVEVRHAQIGEDDRRVETFVQHAQGIDRIGRRSTGYSRQPEALDELVHDGGIVIDHQDIRLIRIGLHCVAHRYLRWWPACPLGSVPLAAVHCP